MTVEVLWAPTGVADPYTGSTEATFYVELEITDLVANGWNLAQNYSSGAGTAPTGLVTTTAFGATATTKDAGGVASYNSGSPFEINIRDLYGGGANGDSGDDIQMIFIAIGGAYTSYESATALGISDPFLNIVGSSATDPNSDFVQSGDTDEVTGGTNGPARFFVGAPIPEPTTLKLAGLCGLLIFFRSSRGNETPAKVDHCGRPGNADLVRVFCLHSLPCAFKRNRCAAKAQFPL
ncbi:MAG TPA: hypothetical protein VNV43_12990 [Candidatus Acidoferrales bacterium]|nr:hypothetical protein [Candidatus Acidoferrales bacterium]